MSKTYRGLNRQQREERRRRAVEYYQRTRDILAAKAFLGHRDIGTTMHYLGRDLFIRREQ